MTTSEWLDHQRFIEQWQDRVLFDPKLNGTAKAVAIAYSRYCNRERGNKRYRCAWPAQETIADRTSMSPGQIKDGLAALRKRGFLHRVGKTGMHGTVINKFRIPETEEDLSWIDKMAPRPDREKTAEQPERVESAPFDVEAHGWDFNSGNVGGSDSGNSASSNGGRIARNPIEGLPARSLPSEPPCGAPLSIGPEEFISIECQHRDELVNYWIKVGPDNGASYWHAANSFATTFAEENRSDWIATFKHFMSQVCKGFQGTEDPVDLAVCTFEDEFGQDVNHRDGLTAVDFQAHWDGRSDKVKDTEFRRAWEHLLCRYPGQEILLSTSSDLVRDKYPREALGIDLTRRDPFAWPSYRP